MSSSVFRVITRHDVVRNRRFGTVGPIFKGQAVQEARPLKMGLRGSPETSACEHRESRNKPEDGRIQI
jgi:hypothetical protein